MIFCGLGINNTIMYDQVKKSWAKQSVALDVRARFLCIHLYLQKHCYANSLTCLFCACESYRIYFSVSFTITASLLYVPINISSGVTHLPRSHSKQQLLHGKCKLPSYLFSLSGLLYLAPLFCLIFPEECTNKKKVLISLRR